MDDQNPVCRLHSPADLDHQPDPRLRRKRLRIAITIQWLPPHPLHHQVRLVLVRHSRIEQTRNPRMIEPRQNLLLSRKTRGMFGLVEVRLNQLQRNLLHFARPLDFRRVNDPHAALTQNPGDRIRPHLGRHRRFAKHSPPGLRRFGFILKSGK